MDIPFDDLQIYKIPESQGYNLINAKNVDTLVVVKQSDYNNHGELLINILKAVNLEFNINAFLAQVPPDQSINISEIHQQINFRTALIFYLPTKSIGLNMRAYKHQVMSTENFDILYSNTLENLDADKNNKIALWNCLKAHYQ